MVTALSACSSVKVTVKEPNFDKKGKEITQAEFNSQLAEAVNNNEFFKANLNLGSTIFKNRYSAKYTQKKVLNDKTYYNTEYMELSDTVIQYDTVNSVMKKESIIKAVEETKTFEGDDKSTFVSSTTNYHQNGTGEYANKVLSISVDYKTFTTAANVVQGETHKQKMDAILAVNFVSIFEHSQIVNFGKFADASYRFYKNKNTFTLSFKASATGSQMELIDGKQTEVLKFEKVREVKVQANLSNGNGAVKLSDEEKVVHTVFANWNNYKKGEIIETETVEYIDCTAVGKDTRIRRIEDLSSYKYI